MSEKYIPNQKGSDRLQKKRFIKNGMILVITSLLIRSMGLLFRSFLSEQLGAEGMGLYQLALSVYMVFVLVSSSGVSMCSTRLFADYSAAGDRGKAIGSVQKCMVFSFVSGVMLSILLYASSDVIAECLLQDSRASLPLKLLSPSLPFLAVSAAVRGYFLARRKTLPTSGEQLLEQLSEICIFILLFSLHRPESLTEACCMTVSGTAAAEGLSFVYSLILFFADRRRLSVTAEKTDGFVKKMLPLYLPVTANACLRSGLSAAENALIPSGLQKFGFTSRDAISRYGIISGMTMTALVFPSVLILPFAMLIVPEIAEIRVSSSPKTIRRISEVMITRTLQFALPVTVWMMFFGIPLCKLLFKNEEAGIYLMLLSPVVPFMYLDSVVDGILKGLNEQTSYFVFNTIDSILRVILTALLLPLFGIAGVIAVIIISELLNTLMSLARLIRLTKLRLSLTEAVLLPLMTALIPCLTLQICPCLPHLGADVLCKLTLCSAFCVLIHFGLKKTKPSFAAL